MEVFFFLVSGSVCLCGAAGHGVGRDFLGADHRLLPVQLQLVARALASQLPGERLDALGRHHQGVDTGQWLLWRLEDELKLCHTGSCLAVWSQVCRKEESSLPSVWTVPYLPRSRSHLVWILFTHLYHFYTEKKQEITQHALFIETCLSSAVDIFFCLHCEIWRTAACDHWMWKDCSSTITLKNTLPVKRCRQVGSYVVFGPRATNCFQFRLRSHQARFIQWTLKPFFFLFCWMYSGRKQVPWHTGTERSKHFSFYYMKNTTIFSVEMHVEFVHSFWALRDCGLFGNIMCLSCVWATLLAKYVISVMLLCTDLIQSEAEKGSRLTASLLSSAKVKLI